MVEQPPDPACGGAPVALAITKARTARFCACSLCATQWHVVRIKCVLCKSTEGIAYQALDCGPQTVQTDTCEKCHGYVKILQQHKDPELEPFADAAALGLDILLREDGYRSGGVNSFLLSY